MELIIFASLYQTKEGLIFYVHFFIEELSIYVARQKWCCLSFIWTRLRRQEIQRSPRTLLGVCVWPFLSSSWVAFGRPSNLWAVLPGVPRHWRFPPASGGHPPRLIPASGGWVYCLAPEAPQKGECRRGRRYFWPCRTRVGFGPATGPTLKTALCHIRALVGRFDKYRDPCGLSRNLRMALDLGV